MSSYKEFRKFISILFFCVDLIGIYKLNNIIAFGPYEASMSIENIDEHSNRIGAFDGKDLLVDFQNWICNLSNSTNKYPGL